MAARLFFMCAGHDENLLPTCTVQLIYNLEIPGRWRTRVMVHVAYTIRYPKRIETDREKSWS